jgi:hypothetical protein
MGEGAIGEGNTTVEFGDFGFTPLPRFLAGKCTSNATFNLNFLSPHI